MQTLVTALSNGSIYAILALAIGMVGSTTGIVNFANGSVVMIGAMISWYVMLPAIGLGYVPALILAIIASAILNILIYELCVKRLGNLQVNVGWILTMFGASIILDNAARMFFGTEAQKFPYIFEGARLDFLDANIYIHELLMIIIAVVIGAVYQTVVKKTRFGRAVRAVEFNPSTAELMGIKSEWIILACFGLAGAVAAIGGALIAPITYASYTMTGSVGMKGFAAAVLGGFGDTKGAFIGGFVLGIIESVAILFIPLGLKDAVAFFIMIIALIFMPGGIISVKIFNKNGPASEKV